MVLPTYEPRITLGNYLEIALLLIGFGVGWAGLEGNVKILNQQIEQDRERLEKVEVEVKRLASEYTTKERLDAERRYLLERLNKIDQRLDKIETHLR